MPVSSGFVTAPVDIEDAHDVLLYQSGYDLGTLCSSSYINKWSKYKPVKYTSKDTTGQLNSNKNGWASSSSWWKASDGKCGLSITHYTAFGTKTSGFVGALIDGLPWDYVPPTGSTYPYRLIDFLNYNHNAMCPIGDIASTTLYIDSNNEVQVDFDLAVATSDAYNLQLTDITINGVSMADMYLGMVWWNSSTFYSATSDTTLGNSSGSISMTLSDMYAYRGNSYRMLPFISSSAWDNTGSVQSGTYASIGLTSPYTITFVGTSQIIQVSALPYWTSTAHTTVVYECYSKSTSSSSVSGTVTVALMRKTSSQDYGEGSVVGSAKTHSITIPANDDGNTVRASGSFTSVSYSSSYIYYVMAQFRTSATTYEATYYEIEEQAPE